jgi:glycerol-3-phosphate dehydrogenase
MIVASEQLICAEDSGLCFCVFLLSPLEIFCRLKYLDKAGGNLYDLAIIGCGVVGAACAFELSRYDLRLVVLEKENDICCGASRANSGIIHAGYYPEPGTLMARLNVEGARLSKQLCKQLGVSLTQCGSLVVALREGELETLRILYERGLANGVEGLELWDEKTLKIREPGISPQALGALYAPGASVLIPWEYTLALAEAAAVNGAEIRLESAVTAIEKLDSGFRLSTASGPVESKFVINAAGVDSDTVHNMVAAPEFVIRPERGEYYLLDKSSAGTVRRIVFQCPSKAGKGVLVAPTSHGNIIVGPNSEGGVARDDVPNTAGGLGFVRDSAVKSVPMLALKDNIRNFSGLRASSDKKDFIISQALETPGFFDAAAIKSPGLSAAPAIARLLAAMLKDAGLAMREKAQRLPRPERVVFSHLSPDEKRELTAARPEFGRVICRCEGVTEGEVLEAIHSPIPPRSIDAIKRRCGTGMGRCQGGFCGPRVLELLSRETGTPPTAILQDTAGSYILCGETKGAASDA